MSFSNKKEELKKLINEMTAKKDWDLIRAEIEHFEYLVSEIAQQIVDTYVSNGWETLPEKLQEAINNLDENADNIEGVFDEAVALNGLFGDKELTDMLENLIESVDFWEALA